MSGSSKVAAFLTVAFILSMAAGCFGGEASGVRVAEVERGEFSDVVSAVGVLDAASPVDVNPTVSGTIVSLPAKEGDYVVAGDMLATLDQEELAQQATQARANYLTSASIGDILEGQYANISNLYESARYFSLVFQSMQGQVDSLVLGFMDTIASLGSFLTPEQQEYLDSLLEEQREAYLAAVAGRPAPPDVYICGYPDTAAAADAARVESAGYEYERVAQGASNPHITAPVAGYVLYPPQQAFISTDTISQLLGGMGSLTSSMGSLSSLLGGDLSSLLGETGQGGELKVGSRVTAGQPAFQIVDLKDMKVNAQVEETDIPDIKPDQPVNIFLDAYPDRTFTGKVIQVGVKSETGSAGTTIFPVVIQMDMTDIPLRLGYNATVDITVLSETDVISLPITALLSRDGVDYVYVVEGGKANLREIVVGQKTSESVEVVAGLEDGEMVVVEGVGEVKEGQRVD
jgi:multidrug efflux pump subunit AcrA (membrane-fusion protein)